MAHRSLGKKTGTVASIKIIAQTIINPDFFKTNAIIGSYNLKRNYDMGCFYSSMIYRDIIFKNGFRTLFLINVKTKTGPNVIAKIAAKNIEKFFV